MHNGGPAWKPVYGKQRHTIEFENNFWIRAQVRDTTDGQTHYSFKQWNEGESEPAEWSVQSMEPFETDLSTGALCIVPHNSEVTIHSITVRPLD